MREALAAIFLIVDGIWLMIIKNITSLTGLQIFACISAGTRVVLIMRDKGHAEGGGDRAQGLLAWRMGHNVHGVNQ